ncbi:MAG: hypothetical protein HKL82_05375 [Acidimicrobiaceae bacterium]|nr:hypothetical protein [Acidimicrobiaceae bacterium]
MSGIVVVRADRVIVEIRKGSRKIASRRAAVVVLVLVGITSGVLYDYERPFQACCLHLAQVSSSMEQA